MKGCTCDGQMSIFDILGQEPNIRGQSIANEEKCIKDDTRCRMRPCTEAQGVKCCGECEFKCENRCKKGELKEKPQMAAVKNECGEWVKEHGKRLMFEELEENKFYIHDYSTTSNEFFKVVYTKKKTEDTIMYVDSPRGIKAEWSWGNSFSALSRKDWVDGEECHCGWFYEMPTEGKQIGWPLDIRGIYDDGYCPNCDHPFDQYLRPDEIDCEVCPECGTPLDWRRWHKMNDEGSEDGERDQEDM